MAGWACETYNTRILAVGGIGEEWIGKEFREAFGETLVDAIGQTTLRQTAALLKHCRLFVGVDSGPMYLAAAAGIPVVEISCHPRDGSPLHANSPRRFGPWGVPSVVLQPGRGCGSCSEACEATEPHCILKITVDQAKRAVESMISRGPRLMSTKVD